MSLDQTLVHPRSAKDSWSNIRQKIFGGTGSPRPPPSLTGAILPAARGWPGVNALYGASVGDHFIWHQTQGNPCGCAGIGLRQQGGHRQFGRVGRVGRGKGRCHTAPISRFQQRCGSAEFADTLNKGQVRTFVKLPGVDRLLVQIDAGKIVDQHGVVWAGASAMGEGKLFSSTVT